MASKDSPLYRRITVRMHGDKRFRELSDPQPCGKYLWVYLLTGPHTTRLPGIFIAGEAGLAEALRWPLEGFREAFREVLSKGLVEVDPEARLMYLPNAIKHNPPESPNVVDSWSKEIELLPECELRDRWAASVRAFLYNRSEAYGKAFDKAWGKATGKPFGKACPNQEQEQEQLISSSLPPIVGREEDSPEPKLGSGPAAGDNGSQDGQEDVQYQPPAVTLPLNDGSRHQVFQTDIDHYAELYPAVDVLQELRKMQGWLEANPGRRKTQRGIKRFIANWLAKEQDRARGSPGQPRAGRRAVTAGNLLAMNTVLSEMGGGET